jgi:uncharacterized RDD family membrane protein YckC
MNSPDTQPGLDPAAYFDPDTPDTSEQRFSASLDAPVERPRFVLDVPAEEDSGGEAAKSETQAGMAEELGAEVAVAESVSMAPLESEEAGAAENDWRDQVSAKVSNYRSRKPRKDRYPSLQLRFEGTPHRNQTPLGAPADGQAESTVWVENQDLQTPRVTEVTLEATARVLEFPRSAAPSYAPATHAPPTHDDELAEPVMARPRIVEAPELLPPPPALGGILIESVVPAEMERRPGFDVPLQSSPFSRRLLAGAVDAGIVATALATFAYIFCRVSGAVLPWRPAAEGIAGLLVVLWPVYQYAFLVFSKTTPGLRLAGLEVTRFDGAPASRSLRRWRALASLLSWASLGLGYAWCLLDEDRLSWHDRITRTHLGPARLR